MIILKSVLCLVYFATLVRGDDYEVMLYNDDIGDCECELEIYEANVEHGIIKSPHWPRFDSCSGRCIYQILPHVNKSVSMYTSQFEITDRSALFIYCLVPINGDYVRIPHAKVKKHERYYYYSSTEESFPGFVSAKNVGYEIHFLTTTTAVYSDYNNFKMSFDRDYEYDEVCDFPIVTVGETETVVQRSHIFRSASGCVYTLEVESYSDGDEIMISIGDSDENIVSVRSLDAYGKLKGEPRIQKERTLMVDAKEVQILSHKSSRTNGAYKMAKITARLVKRNCDCGETEYTVSNVLDPTVTIHNPGYPDLFCPNRNCKYIVKVVEADEETQEIGILQISINALFSRKDSFSLTTTDKDLIESSRYKDQPAFIKDHFVVKKQTLELNYYSSEDYTERYFEVNITHRMVPPQCICNFYKDKSLSDIRTFEITFPDDCNFIYCNFHINGQFDSERCVVDFSIKGAAPGDHVVIRDRSHDEMYDYTALSNVNRYEADTKTSFTYFRENVTSSEMSVLFFNYTIIENKESCNGFTDSIMAEDDNPAVITSPGYPKQYENSQRCEYIVSVPEGSRMVLSLDEISLENFHDYVTIYEGNSTDGAKIGTYTGPVSHKVLNVSSATVLIVFFSDESTSDRGFHITATARPPPEDEEETFTRTYILIGLGLLFIISIFVTIYCYESRRGDHRLPRFVRNIRRNGRQEVAAEQPTGGNTTPHIAGTAPTQQPQGVLNIFE